MLSQILHLFYMFLILMSDQNLISPRSKEKSNIKDSWKLNKQAGNDNRHEGRTDHLDS